MARRVYFPTADASVDPGQVQKATVTARDGSGLVTSATLFMTSGNLTLTNAGDLKIATDEFSEIPNPKT